MQFKVSDTMKSDNSQTKRHSSSTLHIKGNEITIIRKLIKIHFARTFQRFDFVFLIQTIMQPFQTRRKTCQWSRS